MENMQEKGIFPRIYTWFRNLTLKGLLGVILVVFIILVILMSASYIPGIMSRISSSLSAALYSVFVPAENATMTVNKKILNSGEDFNIIFKKGDATNGLFTISYACDPSVELYSVESNGLKIIDCDTSYYLLDNETAITIRPVTSENLVRLVIDGSFENNETQKTNTVGVARVTVKNDTVGIVTPPATPATSPTPTPAEPTVPNYIPAPAPIQPIYYGKADLAVRMIQVGLLSNGTNYITPRTQFSYQEMVGIKFEVRNDGDANSGPWAFTASLPSISTPTYNSNTQVSLRPGESIIFTLGFSNLSNQSSGLITVNVDPQNIVSESKEYNNIITSTITNTGYSYYNNNQENCSNGYYYNGQYYYTGLCDYNNYNNYNNNDGYYDSYGNFIPYNNYYNNYNYNNLRVSCYARPSDPETRDRVRWYTDVSGGDGDYDYEWTGTNNLNSSAKNPSKTYSSRGIKYASVIVDSDGYRATATCSVYVSN